MGKKVVYYHRIESDFFLKFRNAHQNRKNESQNLSLIVKLYDSVLLFQAIFRKLKLPFQEVPLTQLEYGTGQISKSCQFVKN